ncbi:MAG: terminase family protein [Sphingomonadaceae bacterium]|nr:terminase family protein [Sphingomonadaceae bacterium]
MDLTPPSIDSRRQARALYWLAWRVTDIAEHLHLNRATVESWKQRDRWDDAPCIQRMEAATEARYCALIAKPVKTGSDYKEIDLIGRQIERLARVRRYEEPGGHEGDLNPNVGNRNSGPKAKPVRNHFTDEQAAALRDAFEAGLFQYQRGWYAAGERERTRVILKSRQIGATWYFAREALLDAVETGRNQIFLSASKAQAHAFKAYIQTFAAEIGVKLSGDPIVLSNRAELHFLGTNAKTAQGYHGNFYFDEFFWVHGFDVLNKVASGMAMHKKWRKTYFSTPSSMTHEAYKFWSGERFNKRRKREEKETFRLAHADLQAGLQGPDRIWRQIVTIEDAEAGGCDLFDVGELRLEYNPDEFANLLQCQFTDDTLSMFPLSVMQGCLVDSWVEWKDLRPHAPRPFGDGEVWVGYDPQESAEGDNAALVVVAPPRVPGGKFRILEKRSFRGLDFTDQAKAIREVTTRYRVTHIGIDKSGVGAAVFQLVRGWFPTVVGYDYSVQLKTRMVIQAKAIISRRRLEYDAGWNDVTQSFMAIRRVLTASGEQVTYKASRGNGVGHADLAWAVMHALAAEPIEGVDAPKTKAFLEMS